MRRHPVYSRSVLAQRAAAAFAQRWVEADLASRWVEAATFEENVAQLTAQGADPAAITFLQNAPINQRGILIGALKKNPQATVSDLQATVAQFSTRQTYQPTPLEENIAAGSTPEFRTWVLAELRKLRGKRNSDGSFQYKGFTDDPEGDLGWGVRDLKNQFDEVRDWYQYMLDNQPAFKLSSYNLQQARNASEEWHADMAAQGAGKYYTPWKRNDQGELDDPRIVHRYDDDWFIADVDNRHDREVEGHHMDHCVGGYDCQRARIFSLRDPSNRPKVTMEVDPKEWIFKQIQGHGNSLPSSEYRDRLNEWFDALPSPRYKRDAYNDAEDIYWGDSPEEVSYAIQDTAYGKAGDDDNLHPDFNLPYEEPESPDIADADVKDLYSNAIDYLTRGPWEQNPTSGRYDYRRNNEWKNSYDEVAETLTNVAVNADKAILKKKIKGMEEGHEKPWKSIQDYAKVSKIWNLKELAAEHRDEFLDIYYDHEADRAERDLHQTTEMPYAMDAAIERHLAAAVYSDGELTQLIAEALGRPWVAPHAILSRPKSYQDEMAEQYQYRMLRHIDEPEWNGSNHLPASPEKTEGAWVYAHTRIPGLKRWTLAAKQEGRDKGAFEWSGLSFYIENPKGTYREKKRDDGSTWRRLMKADYGRINHTKGVDGDAVDVFIGPDEKASKAYVVDQVKEDGSFDEHKCVICVDGGVEEAKRLYLSNYPKDWEVGGVTEMTLPEFKKWLKGPKKGPAAAR